MKKYTKPTLVVEEINAETVISTSITKPFGANEIAGDQTFDYSEFWGN